MAPVLIRIEVSSPTVAYKALCGLALCSLLDIFLLPTCSGYPRHAGLPVGSERCQVQSRLRPSVLYQGILSR